MFMRLTSFFLAGILLVPAVAAAQIDMPDPSSISGVPLPSEDVAADSISVRVIRGDFNNLPGEQVEFTIGSRTETMTTDAEGRVLLSGLETGDNVRIVAVVDGERLESQPITVGSSGVRVVLVATDPDLVARADEDRRLAAGPAIEGFVVLGPQSRIVAQMQDDTLTIWYVLQILNSARSPVDIGGPLVFDLPRSARGTSVVEGPPNATANGPRVIITGPFAPGETMVQAAFELPTSGSTARLEQQWPTTLQQVTVLLEQPGGLDLSSPQIASKETTFDQGQALLIGRGPTLAQGQTLELEFSGLPYHPRWPRWVALTLAGVIVTMGVWAAATARPRRAVA
jgi:hypothetical protein